MKCEICGNKEAENNVIVEGTRMQLCIACSKMGKSVGRIRSQQQQARRPVEKYVPEQKEDPVEMLVANYGSLIKAAREKLGYKQEDFAKLLHEKESNLHAIETGHREPRIDLARKMEKILSIKLVEQYEEKAKASAKGHDEPMTIGHMIQFKTRKKQ